MTVRISLTFKNVIRSHFQLVRLAIGLIARFLDFAFAHTSPAAVATKRRGGGGQKDELTRERIVSYPTPVHVSESKDSRVVVYRRFLAGIPAQEEQREGFVVRGNQITGVMLRRVEKRVLPPFAQTEVETTEQFAYGVVRRSSQLVLRRSRVEGFLRMFFLMAKNRGESINEIGQVDGGGSKSRIRLRSDMADRFIDGGRRG